MWIILLLLTSSDFSHYFQQSLFPVIDGFRCWLLPSLVHKILRDGLEVPWHFHLAKLRLVSSLNLPLCSTSCLLIFYNLEMTAPWIIQGKHLGKCPGVESAVIKRGYVCTVSLFSTRCVSIEMPSANCGQLLLPVSTWLLWCSGTDVLVYRPGGPLIHFHLSPGGQPIKTQNRGKGASERLFFLNNRIIFYPCNMVNRHNMPLLLFCKVLVWLQKTADLPWNPFIYFLLCGYSPVWYESCVFDQAKLPSELIVLPNTIFVQRGREASFKNKKAK